METVLLKARIADTADLCERTSSLKFLGFLTMEEALLADKLLCNRNVKYSFFGGFDSAERVMLGCFPDWAECEENYFPITAVTFTYRKADKLSHRDFLGSLMGLGIKRESVGDILVEEGRAVAFLSDDILKFVLTQTEKIGRTGVTVNKGFDLPLPQKGELAEFSVTVASPRVDCVVAALAGVSRKNALEKIMAGEVAINSVLCDKPTLQINAGDAVTVRRKGKFLIDSFGNKTKKDRVVINYKKYV